jgi:apolipoprotein N-acyltransferase
MVSAIEAAGKNNFTLIAFIFYLAANAISLAMKKEKAGTKLTLAISFLAVVGIISFRLIESNRKPETNQQVTVQGNGNGTAVGNGNSVNVDSTKPPEKGSPK